MIFDIISTTAINFPRFKKLSLDRQGQLCAEISQTGSARPSDAVIHKMVGNTLSKLVVTAFID